MQNTFSRPRSVLGAKLHKAAAILVVGSLTLFGGAQAAMAAPDPEPRIPPATTVFIENFENGTGAQVIPLTDYVGVDGTTYTAAPPWLNYADCNNLILRYEDPTWQQSYCGNNGGVRRNVQRLADVLGQVQAGVIGSQDKNNPVERSTPQTRLNHAASAYTFQVNMQPNLVVFESTVLPTRLKEGHFYTGSVDVAELSCEYAGGRNNSKLDFSLVVDGTPHPLQDDPIRACTDDRVGYYTSPIIDDNEWGSGGKYVGAGTYYSDRSYLMPRGAAGEVRLVMTNQTGASQGNDFAYDNIELVDVTPLLSKSFEPTSIEVGGTATLTFTVSNTADLAEKRGWGFTDSLPEGLVVANPARSGGSCEADVSGTPGSNTIVVENGVLHEKEVSCTITIDVTTASDVAVPATFENCASNIDPSVGVVLPKVCAELTVVPGPEPQLELTKDADRANLTDASAGETITYSFTVKNTGNTPLENVTPEEVEFSGTGKLGAFSPEPVRLEPGQSQVFTANYVVTEQDVLSNSLLNTAKATGNMPGAPPIESGPDSKEIPVLRSGFELRKASDPKNGDAVVPGEKITYTVTGKNTGATLLDPVIVTDDLSEVLNNARLVEQPTASIDGKDASDGLVFDQRLRRITWTGKLQPGETVTIKYAVRVNADSAGKLLKNSASGSATPPGLPPIRPERPTTEHPVLTAGFELAKTSNPRSGSPVHPGDTITYTFTGSNTGETVLDPVVITDDLGGIWDYTSLDPNSPKATIGNRDVSSGLALNSTDQTLAWTGVLQAGETVTVTFAVTVNSNVEGVTLDNRVTGSAQPPGPVDPIVPRPPTTEHPVPVPGFELRKTSDPAHGEDVLPGDTINYSVSGQNTGETKLDPVVITDDLSGVLSYATMVGKPSAAIGNRDVSANLEFEQSSQKLTWQGALAPGETVILSYAVTVNPGVQGVEIENLATGSAQPPGNRKPLVPRPPKTEHPVPTPGFDLEKVSNPGDGSTVLPGDTIDYTLTGTNTGATLLNDVEIVDDLSDVLNNAVLTGTPTAYVDGVPADQAPEFDSQSNMLSWKGALEVGEAVTIKYSVKIDVGIAGQVLNNKASAVGTPPGGNPISPPPVDTEHFVPEPGFQLNKTATPANGSVVHPGQEIVYTVTGKNTGGTPLEDVVITDDIGEVLKYASYAGGGSATVDGVDVSDGLSYDQSAMTLTWTGTLQPTETVTLSYPVTVNAGVSGVKLENRVGGSATPPGNPPIIPPDREVEHPVPAPDFSLRKTSNPASGSSVVPGDTIRYSIIGSNTGDTVLDPVQIEDNLSEVLNHATLSDAPSATIDDVDVSAGLNFDEATQQLKWTGALQAGEVVLIEYTVTVNDGAAGTLLLNAVTGSATPPGPEPSNPPITENPPPTEHPVMKPGFELEKSSNPADGSEVHPGDTISYTVLGRNSGETVLDPVVLSDDLSEVLNHAELVGNPVAMIGSADHSDALVFDEASRELSWSGALQVGETVTITYHVRVLGDAEGHLLLNVLHGSAKPPGSTPPIEPTPPTVEHPVPTPGFALEKTSNPQSGSAVHPGDKITYTVVGTNTGETLLDPVVITDDLGSLWDYVTLDETSLSASIGTRNVSDGLHLDRDAERLTWSGALQPDEAVTMAYSVTVNENVQGVTLGNRVTAEAQPPGSTDPIRPVPPQTEHPVPTPGFELQKKSLPGDGAAVLPGDTLSYTVTGENTGETVLDPVVITDDLSQVLPYATLVGTPQAMIGDRDVSDGLEFQQESAQLVWTGALDVGESIVVSYAVTVNNDVQGEVIRNVASGSAQPPGSTDPIIPESPGTKHPVPTPGFDLQKVSDPADGEAVVPGDTISYTLSGINTGETVLDPVVITDDLSEVLNNATLLGEPEATLEDQDVSDGLSFDAESRQLSWSGVLPAGATVTIRYAVTVNNGVADSVILNRATATGTPPGSKPISPPQAETEHPVPAPAFEIGKTSDPAHGSVVRPGQTIVYTVTGTNTGGTVLDPVLITDDLGRVLNNAEYNGDAKAVIGEKDVSSDLRFDATKQTLSWSGVLQPGENVRVSYSVTLNAGASGGLLENRVSGSATPPGHEPLTPPDREVVHRIGVALGATGFSEGALLGGIALSTLLLLFGAAILVARHRRNKNALGVPSGE